MSAGQQEQLRGAAQALAGALFSGDSAGTGTVTRGGMDVSKGGSNKISSLYDLVGAQVPGRGRSVPHVLQTLYRPDAGGDRVRHGALLCRA